MIKEEDLKRIREGLECQLEKYSGKPIKFDIDKDILEEILFVYSIDKYEDETELYKEFALPIKLAKKIDYTGLSFDDFDAESTDFSGLTGVFLNPQTVYAKSLRDATLMGINFIGQSFDDVDITFADFTGSIGAVINPQKVHNRDCRHTRFKDAAVVSNFEGVDLFMTDFNGAVFLNPENAPTISNNSCDVEEVIAKIKSAFK